jgi:dipeptidyl-peptidase-4
MIPLTGATHMAAGGLSECLLRLELDFIRRSLPDPRRKDASFASG